MRNCARCGQPCEDFYCEPCRIKTIEQFLRECPDVAWENVMGLWLIALLAGGALIAYLA